MRAAALVLGLAAARTLATAPADAVGADPVFAAEPCLPDLQRDGWLELSRLPGLGAGRARDVVRARPFLGVPLTPARLKLIPGVGEHSAAEVEAWYRRGGREPPAPRG